MIFYNVKHRAKLILCLALLCPFQNSFADSTFNSSVKLDFSIDNIFNNMTAGDLSKLSLIATFQQADASVNFATLSGDGQITVNNPDIAPLSLNTGSVFSNQFAVTGNTANGSVDSSTTGWYTLQFINTSTTDDYTVNLSLAYQALASVSGEFADSDVILDVFTDSNPAIDNLYINANSINALSTPANSAFPSYSLNIAAGSTFNFYVDATIKGSLAAAPAAVPVPAAFWTFLAGLMSFYRLNRTKSHTQPI